MNFLIHAILLCCNFSFDDPIVFIVTVSISVIMEVREGEKDFSKMLRNLDVRYV